MYVITKQVYGIKYYWNHFKSQWEGLKDNASYIPDAHVKNVVFNLRRTANDPVDYLKIN